MQSMAMFDETTGVDASGIYVTGDLKLSQRVLLDANIDNTAYDYPVMNSSVAVWGPNVGNLSWGNVMADYDARNSTFYQFYIFYI
jgi:hypothetical protein